MWILTDLFFTVSIATGSSGALREASSTLVGLFRWLSVAISFAIWALSPLISLRMRDFVAWSAPIFLACSVFALRRASFATLMLVIGSSGSGSTTV